MYRQIGLTGYEYNLAQQYVADVDGDVATIPTTYYGYVRVESEANVFYPTAAFTNATSGALNVLYIDVPTNQKYLYTGSAFVGVSTPLQANNYANMGSTVYVLGSGSGLVRKMLNSKGSWIVVGTEVV